MSSSSLAELTPVLDNINQFFEDAMAQDESSGQESHPKIGVSVEHRDEWNGRILRKSLETFVDYEVTPTIIMRKQYVTDPVTSVHCISRIGTIAGNYDSGNVIANRASSDASLDERPYHDSHNRPRVYRVVNGELYIHNFSRKNSAKAAVLITSLAIKRANKELLK